MTISWFNGEMGEGDISLSPHERGLTLGDGLFETVAVIEGRPHWLQRHITRMKAGADELGLKLDGVQLTLGVTAILEASQHPMEVMRITLMRGVGARGLASDGAAPSLLITLDPFDEHNRFKPCTLGIAKVRRNEHAPSSRLKTLSYIDGIAAARQTAWIAEEALMLNTAGYVASATTANVFVMKARKLITPSLSQGILSGVMRALVLDAARERGLVVEERVVRREEVGDADGLFLTNSLRFMRPVSAYNGEDKDVAHVHALIEVFAERLLKG